MRTLAAIFISLCTIGSGCTTYTPVTVSVRNTNGQAIHNASVQISPMYFFNPTDESFLMFGEYEIIEPFPGKGAFGITDYTGEVTLKIVEGNPSSLIVLAPHNQQWQGQISISEQNRVVLVPTVINTSDIIVTAK